MERALHYVRGQDVDINNAVFEDLKIIAHVILFTDLTLRARRENYQSKALSII